MAKMNEASAFAKWLGNRLRAARGDRTFQDVADATGGFIHPRMVQNYEEGTEPKVSTFLVLAAALGMKPEDLIPPTVTLASRKRNTEDVAHALASC